MTHPRDVKSVEVLYTLDNLPDPILEAHHALIAQDTDNNEYYLLTKHYVVHQLAPDVYFSYIGWADATDEESMQ